MRRILVTGAAGMLAPYLGEVADAFGTVVMTARHGGDEPCDLAAEAAVRDLLATVRPDWVVHAAGLTDVDACELDPQAADLANHRTAANLAGQLHRSSRLAVISTDQVYPDTPGPHGEADTSPVNCYGRSKLAGERAALEHPGAVALRTNMFGRSRTEGRRSLDDFVANNLRQGRPITLFSDVFFSPLHMSTLAVVVHEMLDCGLTGAFNAGCRDGMSKAQFGLAVARHLELSAEAASIGSADSVNGRAPRPHDMRLDVTHLETVLGRTMPTLKQEIEKL